MRNLLLVLALFSFMGMSKRSVKIEPIPQVTSSFYKVESTLNWIKQAAIDAECVTKLKSFHEDILKVEKYTHFNGKKSDIVKNLLSNKVARVGSYYKWPTYAIAYRNVGSDKIWFNRAKYSVTNRAGKVNTMMHERLHVLGYGHKGNKRYEYENEKSVPYKVGSLAEKYAKNCIN